MIQTGIYKHFKGGTVFVFGTSKFSEDDSILVNYIGLQNGEICSRPISSFQDLKTLDGVEVPRFKLVKEVDVDLTKFLSTFTDNKTL